MKNIELSIIIINYNTAKLTLDCIKSVVKHTKLKNFEIILIDNASEKVDLRNLSKNIKQFENVELVKSRENLGFAAGNNLGLKKAKGKYVLFLNSDTIVESNLLKEMVDWLEKNKEYGLASCALKNPDGSLQQNGGYFPNLLTVFKWMFFIKTSKQFHPNLSLYKKSRDLDWITGAFMLFRKQVLDEVGGFDPDYFMYTEDVDLCFRVRKAGWKVKYLHKWSITHFGGQSSNKEFALVSEFKGVKLFYEKHYPAWQMPILRMLLKIGSIFRIFLVSPKIYVKTFKTA